MFAKMMHRPPTVGRPAAKLLRGVLTVSCKHFGFAHEVFPRMRLFPGVIVVDTSASRAFRFPGNGYAVPSAEGRQG